MIFLLVVVNTDRKETGIIILKNSVAAEIICCYLCYRIRSLSALLYLLDQFFEYLACGETVRGALRAAEIYPEVFAERYKLVVFNIRGSIQDLPCDRQGVVVFCRRGEIRAVAVQEFDIEGKIVSHEIAA